jgi:hypothetical protein
MTSIIDRFTAHDDPEAAPMTTPRTGYPAGSAVPWWAGVPGLDPACPAPPAPEFAARIAAYACARHIYGPGADAGSLFGKSPARKYADWLEAAPDDMEAWARRYALRRACDDADVTAAGDILDAAGDTVAFLLGRRR